MMSYPHHHAMLQVLQHITDIGHWILLINSYSQSFFARGFKIVLGV